MQNRRDVEADEPERIKRMKFTTDFTLSNGKRFATDGKGHYWTSSNRTGEMMPTSRSNYSMGLHIYKSETEK